MAGISGTVELLVKTEVMVAQANEVRTLASNMKDKFHAMEELMNKTKSYWIGEAGDIHRKRYEEQKEDIEMMLRRIYEHPDDLLQMAGIYNDAERINIEASNKLPDSIIE